jgi:hypothetical protein
VPAVRQGRRRQRGGGGVGRAVVSGVATAARGQEEGLYRFQVLDCEHTRKWLPRFVVENRMMRNAMTRPGTFCLYAIAFQPEATPPDSTGSRSLAAAPHRTRGG